MKRVACPHCGFLNFEISAYCGRCERPIPKTVPNRAATPAPAGTAPGRTPPTRTPSRRGPSADAGKLTLPKVPPPAPPVARNVSPAPLPIEIKPVQPPRTPAREIANSITETLQNQDALGDLPEATEHLDTSVDAVDAIEAASTLSGDNQATTIEVPVHPASVLQIFIARFVDMALALSVGVAVAWMETLIFSVPWHPPEVGLGDLMAEWLHAHPGAALHGAIAALLTNILHNIVAARSGRTIGCTLTGTVLVRASGQRLGFAIVALRTIVSIISLTLFGAGFFWPIVDRQHRTWHDLVAGTVVVRRRVRL